MGINYKALLRLHEQYEDQPDKTPEPGRWLREQLGYSWDGNKLKERAFRPTDFEIGRLFEECFGPGEFRAGRSGKMVHEIMEAAGAVSTAAFKNITGQIVYSAIMDSYNDEEFVLTKVLPDKQSLFIGKEKVAGITQIGDQELVTPEGQPFPYTGVGETWIAWPEVQKRGQIVALTREMIFAAGSNGLPLLERCQRVGYWCGVNKEKRIIDCIIDGNGGSNPNGPTSNPQGHRYNWRDVSIQTYGANSGTHTWANLVTTNGLSDWTNIDSAEQTLNQQTDPDTGEPIVAEFDSLIAAKDLEKAAMRILHATEIRVVTPGYATSGAPTQTVAANPYQGKFNILTSRLLRTRLTGSGGAATTWFFGAPSRAFIYKTIFPMQVLEAPANSIMEFQSDIVRQFRADEMGGPTTVEPRYMTKNTA